MKNLSQFLEHLKDEVLSPLSEIELFSMPDSGDFTIRLLARRGDVTVLPHHKAKLHFVPLRESGRKDPIRCIGRNCPLCAYCAENPDDTQMLRPSMKAFFYCLRKGKVAIFSAPLSFLEGLYGSPGKASDVTSLALKGVSVFDPSEGRDLFIKRENTDGITYWNIRVSQETAPITNVQYEDLLTAPRLSDTYYQLNQSEMEIVCRFLEGRTKELPNKLKGRRKGA